MTAEPVAPHVSVEGKSLAGRTILMSGGSRGIGLALAVRAAQDGANVAMIAKTDQPDPRLQGTIHTAAEAVRAAGGAALPIVGDVRSDESIEAAVAQAVAEFGGIDIVVNNASAINLSGTLDLPPSRYDLMQDINTRGTFMLSRAALPHLLKADNPHVLSFSPPLNLDPKWLGGHTGYTIAKYGMSMATLGIAAEFAKQGITASTLWPRTAVRTDAVKNILGGEESLRRSRIPEVYSNAAYLQLLTEGQSINGGAYVAEDVLIDNGFRDLEPYAPGVPAKDLIADFFL